MDQGILNQDSQDQPEMWFNPNYKKRLNRHKKQKYQCNDCHRQFVENPKSRTIPTYKTEIIDKLLLERISLAGIARAVGVSIRWLQNYVNNKFQQEVQISAKKGTFNS